MFDTSRWRRRVASRPRQEEEPSRATADELPDGHCGLAATGHSAAASFSRRLDLPIVRLSFLRSVLVHPLSADRAHVAFSVGAFATDPRPDGHGHDKNRSTDRSDHEGHEAA